MQPAVHREAAGVRARVQRAVPLLRPPREPRGRLPRPRALPPAGARHVPLRAPQRRARLQRQRTGLCQVKPLY